MPTNARLSCLGYLLRQHIRSADGTPLGGGECRKSVTLNYSAIKAPLKLSQLMIDTKCLIYTIGELIFLILLYALSCKPFSQDKCACQSTWSGGNLFSSLFEILVDYKRISTVENNNWCIIGLISVFDIFT